MPKRVADKQLTDRNVDEEEDVGAEPTGEFAKAEQTVIAARKIRPLPGRRAPSAATPPAPSTSSTATNGKTDEHDDETKQLIAQRGLNASAKNAFRTLTERIDADPFVDLVSTLNDLAKRYETHWLGAQTKSGSQPAPGPAPGPALAPTPSAAPSFGAPAPPSGGFSFGGITVDPSKPAVNTSSSPGTGFTPKPVDTPSTSTSPFSFPPAAAVPEQAKSDKSSLTAFNSVKAASATPHRPSPLREAQTLESSPGAANSPPKKDEAAKFNPFAGFAFGPPAASTVSKSETKSETKSVETSKTFSPFGGSNNATPPPPSGFSFGGSTSNTPFTPPAGFTFGAAPTATTSSTSTSPSAFAMPSASTPKPPSTPSASFGSGKPVSPPVFGFGKAPSPTSAFGSANVGFSFGASGTSSAPASNLFGMAPAPSKPFAGFGAASGSTTGSLFGGGGSATTSTPAVESEVTAEGEENADEGGGESKLLQAGAGEEDETTVEEVKARLYADSIAEKSAICNVRLKRNDKTGVARILARNEGNGSVVLNTRLYKGFKFVAQAKAEGDKREAVSYVFHVFSSDSVKPAIWRMRAKEIKATPFVEAVDAEVAKL